eukprot:3163768-Prymnesium_polylepis.1
MKATWLHAAALSQATPRAPTSAAAVKPSSCPTLEQEASASPMLLLRLPFAEEDPFFVTLKKEQFEQAKSLGDMVGEDVFDVLREIERRQFSKQIDKLPAECAIDRDQAVDR